MFILVEIIARPSSKFSNKVHNVFSTLRNSSPLAKKASHAYSYLPPTFGCITFIQIDFEIFSTTSSFLPGMPLPDIFYCSELTSPMH